MVATTTSTPRCGCRHPDACVDPEPGRYLAAIYGLGVGSDDPVRTGAVSDRLDVAPASVTGMFERLDAAGLVDHRKREGATLTDRGERVARELAWRRCVVRTFFGVKLGFELPEDAGFRIGFALPHEGVERLRSLADAGVGNCRRREKDGGAEAECCPLAEGPE